MSKTDKNYRSTPLNCLRCCGDTNINKTNGLPIALNIYVMSRYLIKREVKVHWDACSLLYLLTYYIDSASAILVANNV